MKKKKTKSMLILVLLLLGITIGYAVLSTNLNISGTGTINKPTWDVHWSNINVTSGSVTPVTAATISNDGLTVTYAITLSTPGDYYEFTVDAVNNGSIDAMIESMSNKIYESNGTTERTKPEYLVYKITYNDGTYISNYQKLSANTTEKYKVRVEFDRDVDVGELPSSNETLVFKLRINYIQADSTAIPVRGPYVFTNHISSLTIGNTIPTGATTYQTYEDAIENTYNQNGVCIKHRVNNNTVVDSFMGFYDGISVYFLRGGGATYNSQTNTYNNDSPYYNSNKNFLLNLLGDSNCNTNASCGENCTYTTCNNGTVLYPNGKIAAGWYDYECVIEADGSSYCISYI